jgi:hypothetical protein
MTGSIIHGHALGNRLNAADLEDTVESITFPVMGKVLVFSSDQNPANLNIQTMKPAMFMKHQVTPSIKPVLSKLSGRYSPVQSIFYLILFCKFKLNP